MSDQVAQLRQEIDALERAIDALAALPAAQQPLQEQLVEKQRRLPVIQIQSGGVNFGVGNTIEQHGDSVGADKVLRDKVVNNFFGGSPSELGETLLMDYLLAL